jgi:Integrase zinc binding domain
MPADYLSRLPATKEAVSTISAFNPFQADLFNLQMQDAHLQMLQNFMSKNKWPPHFSKQDCNNFQNRADKAFKKKWWSEYDSLTSITLYLPSKFCKEAMCEAHDIIFGGHNANQKMYLKISTSYYWPKMIQDIEKLLPSMPTMIKVHTVFLIKKTPLAPLPIPD